MTLIQADPHIESHLRSNTSPGATVLFLSGGVASLVNGRTVPAVYSLHEVYKVRTVRATFFSGIPSVFLFALNVPQSIEFKCKVLSAEIAPLTLFGVLEHEVHLHCTINDSKVRDKFVKVSEPIDSLILQP